MFDDNNFVERLMEKPDAMLIIKEAQHKLKEEQKKREEFYNLIGEDDKAEFINGEIVFHSPVMKTHGDATGALYKMLSLFVEKNKRGWVGIEKIMTRFTRNDYEPDVCFFGNEKAQGFEDKQLLFPVPDFVVEVLSKSNQENIKRDTVVKYDDYEKHGVSEYWIVDPHEKTVEQYVLKNEKYRTVLPAADGIIRSHAVKGFNIPIEAIFDADKSFATVAKIMSGKLPD